MNRFYILENSTGDGKVKLISYIIFDQIKKNVANNKS
jgi:hypothetical protein